MYKLLNFFCSIFHKRKFQSIHRCEKPVIKPPFFSQAFLFFFAR